MDENSQVATPALENFSSTADALAVEKPTLSSIDPSKTQITETNRPDLQSPAPLQNVNVAIEEPTTTEVIDASVIGSGEASAGGSFSGEIAFPQSTRGAALPSAFGDTEPVDAIAQRLEDLQRETVGRAEFTAEEQTRQGIGRFEQEIADINKEIGIERNALRQTLIDNEGRAQGQFSRRARGEAARAMAQTAANIEALSSASAAAQGNLTVAQNAVQRAVQAKFEPIEEEIRANREILELRKGTLSLQERKLAERREEALKSQERSFQLQKMTMSQDMNSVASAVKDGRISAAQGARINQQLVNGDRSGMNAIPLAGSLLTEEEMAAISQAEATLPILDKKLSNMDALLENDAIGSVVGPTFLARREGGFLGGLKRFATGALSGGLAAGAAGSVLGGVGAIPAGIGGALVSGTAAAVAPGLPDVVTGQRQDFIAGVEQMVSQEFLDSLINVKAQGATFGALQKAEQDALTQAATKIGTWRIANSDGTVLGYNASEESFKEEIQTIRNLTNLAMTRAGGSTLSPQEDAVLDAIFEDPATFDTSVYY